MKALSNSMRALALLGCVSAAAPALAQDAGWSVTVTPRYQHLFFLPDTDADSGLESMPTYGGTVALRNPNGRFGLAGTYLQGKADGTYSYDDGVFSDDYDYRAKRKEYSLHAEYTPGDTNITFLAGFHRFAARSNETRVGGTALDNEINSYRQSISAGELGIRLASRLGAESRQTISAQFIAGIGSGRVRVNERETASGTVFVDQSDDKGTGYTGDIALGYNIFLTNSLSLGARARGYVFYVDAEGGDPIFAVAPEFNISVRF